MSGSKQTIKTRIRGIKTTKKITKAMELIAIGKLKRQRDLFESNRIYAQGIKDTISDILSNTKDVENVFIEAREDTHPLTIVFVSDMGLCGGYNSNVIRQLLDGAAQHSEILVIGSRGKAALLENGFQLTPGDIPSDNINYLVLFKLAEQIIDRYRHKTITSISIIYTEYVNSMRFVAKTERLLPVSYQEHRGEKYQEIIYEPNAEAILEDLIPLYLKSLLYSYWLESTTSEHSARRLAMDLATDNAEELIDHLTLEYNRARQASITQEINEIVMTADAV